MQHWLTDWWWVYFAVSISNQNSKVGVAAALICLYKLVQFRVC